MKPKPFSALNHFTVPCATCAPTFRACGRPPLIRQDRVLALPPAEHERGTRTARDRTARSAPEQALRAQETPVRMNVPPSIGVRRLGDEAGRPDRKSVV